MIRILKRKRQNVKILIAIIDAAVLLMIAAWLYLKYSLRAMVK